jgi:hypothetical protein
VFINLPDLSGPEGTFMSDVMGALDELERERIRLRVMSGIQQKARRGNVVGNGVAPYGYRFVYARNESKRKDVPVAIEPDPATRAVVERVFCEAATVPLREIARRLMADGVAPPTTRTQRWNASVVGWIIRCRTYIGEWSYAGITVAVPSLIDSSTWAEAQRRIAERRTIRRRRCGPDDAEYLLRGMLTCGHCGGLLSTDRRAPWVWKGERRPGQRIYRCKRHSPRHARLQGTDVCELVPAPAARDGDLYDMTRRLGIEDIARHWVETQILNPRAFARFVERVDGLHGEAQRAHERWLADLDAKIAHHEHRMNRAGDRLLDLTDDDPRVKMLKESSLREADLVRQLRIDRAALAAVDVPGISPATLRRLQEIATAYAERLDTLDRAAWREVYREIKLRGVVTLDPSGPWRMGHRRYTVSWEAQIISGSSEQCRCASWTPSKGVSRSFRGSIWPSTGSRTPTASLPTSPPIPRC